AGMEQGAPIQDTVLSHKQENETVDDAQELAMEVGQRHCAGSKSIAQRDVLRMASEPLAKDRESLLDTAPHTSEGAGALLLRLLGQLFQPACLQPFAFPWGKPGCVGN